MSSAPEPLLGGVPLPGKVPLRVVASTSVVNRRAARKNRSASSAKARGSTLAAACPGCMSRLPHVLEKQLHEKNQALPYLAGRVSSLYDCVSSV